MSMTDLNSDQGIDGGNTGSGGVFDGLGDLEGDDQDLILAAEGMEKKTKSSTFVLIGVVVIAGASLFSMHTLTKANASGVRNKKLERTINDFLTNGTDTTAPSEKVLSLLTPVDPVDRPFDRNLFADVAGGPATAAGPRGDTEEGWKVEVGQAAEQLRVTSVMRGRLANINGKIVQIGGIIKESGVDFKISEITTEGVSIEARHEKKGWVFQTIVVLKRHF